MASSVAASGEGRTARATPAASGFTFFAASARNYVPRIVSALAMATVTGVYVGWTWAVPWFLVIMASLGSNQALVGAMSRAETPDKAARVWRISNATSFIFTCLQCAPIVALWFTAKPPAMGFAILGAMIGSTYVLLQYYAEPLQFRLFLTPYVAALALMGWRLIERTDYALPGLVTGVAAAAALFNFFHFSRQLLANSRLALRAAKARAQEKEVAAEAANRAKSAFLATMSHEIRTPLNGVLGMAQAMAAEDLSDLQRERLSVIHRSGESLLAILNDLLDLSKIEAGKLELEAIEFDLGEVARGAHSAFTALANKKGLSFGLDVEQAAGRYQGDPTRLRQILYNLISNALKFTEAGEIRVTATRVGDRLELAVRDTGLGISPENLSRLFGKFDQLDSSTTRRFGGTGLGLSICHELAQLMDGDIVVESEVGVGSCFTLRVNLPRVGDAKPPATLAPAAPSEPASSTLRVLAA